MGQRIQRAEYSLPRQSRKAATTMSSSEPGPEPRHDVVAVVEQRQGGGPIFGGNSFEAFDFGGGRSVDQEAEDVVDGERIVDGLRRLVGLAEQHDGRALLGVEQTFHAGDGGGLILRDVTAVEVAGGKDLDDAGDEAGDDSDLQEEPAKFLVGFLEQVEGPGRGHDEGAVTTAPHMLCAYWIQRPGIQHELPEAGDLIGAVGQQAGTRRGAASRRR